MLLLLVLLQRWLVVHLVKKPLSRPRTLWHWYFIPRVLKLADAKCMAGMVIIMPLHRRSVATKSETAFVALKYDRC